MAVLESKELTIPPLVVDFKPLEISFNFDEINERLDEYLGQKISLVTEETIKDEKKLVASLRKEGDFIKSSFKQYKDKAITPLSDAEKKIIFIVEKFKQTAEAKSEQIKRIEDDTREICRVALLTERDFSWESLAITDEFRKASIDDLIKLTSLTAKGELTKAAKQSVQERVNADLALQNKINGRLLAVENKSLRNDINPPLSRANVEAFLYCDDFDNRLDLIISAEVARKAEAEERMRKKMEAEKQAAIDAALREQQAEADRAAKKKIEDEIELKKQKSEDFSRGFEMKEQIDAIPVYKPNPTEALQENLNQLSEKNARFPSEQTQQAIKNVRAQINEQQKKSSYTIKAIVGFTIESTPDADTEKMKKFFIDRISGSLEANDKNVQIISLVKQEG